MCMWLWWLQQQRMITQETNKQAAKKFVFDLGYQMIPHPEKQYKGGEDAIITRKNLLVVADGVGGWSQHGIDPALYSRNLCLLIGNVYDRDPLYFQDKPQQLLELAVSFNTKQGSSTATIITLNETTGKVKIAYMGDSLSSMYRAGKKTFKTMDHSRSFNQPFQVGVQGDDPKDCCVLEEKEANNGDVVILGSDGIWDNVFDEEIDKTVQDKNSMQALADKLAKCAFGHSTDVSFNSPFAIKAAKKGYSFMGGKSDDISVIAARILVC